MLASNFLKLFREKPIAEIKLIDAITARNMSESIYPDKENKRVSTNEACINLIKDLISRGVNINFVCGDHIPLMLAIRNQDIEVINILLEQPNLKINWQDSNGQSALHLAVSFGYEEIIDLLLPKAKINLLDADGNSPLMLAAGNAKLHGIFDKIFSLSADRNLKNPQDWTALTYLIFTNSNEDRIIKLIGHCDLKTIKRKLINNEDALSFAKQKGMNKVVEIIEKRLAESEINHHTKRLNN